jgi:GAF domain-containing protein
VDLPPRSRLPPEASPVFDRFAKLVANRLDAPVALVTMVDVEGQALPGAAGLPEPWLTERWTPLSHSFCQHVMTSERPLVVQNAHDDELVAHNAAVRELGVVAYAGVPLHEGTADGPVVGAVCAIDHRPRQWTQEQIGMLNRLAADVGRELAGHPRPPEQRRDH